MVAADSQPRTVHYYARRAKLTQAIWGTLLLTVTGLVLYKLMFGYKGADPSYIAWTIMLASVVGIFYRPRYGLYFTLFFALVGDMTLIWWYPFYKNFSSLESIFYINDSIIISPLEAFIGITYLSWLVRGIRYRSLNFHAGTLFLPAMAFAFFMVFGLGWGLTHGGSMTIGLWEARPIFYLPAMLVLASNLLEKREHVHTLLWWIMAALFIEGIVGTYSFAVLLNFDLGDLEKMTEHSAAIHMNTLFVLVASSILYQVSKKKIITLILMVPPVFVLYIITQRRASYIALVIALGIMSYFLYRERQMLFWLLIPPAVMIGMVYLAAFWNNTGPAGMPAQAIKSVVATDQANAKDQRSNLYRDIENVNSQFTIRQVPLTGVGFGNKFYILVPMPDISFFEWWEYITHNSVIWIWMKTGIGGFFTLIFLVGMSLMTGVRSLLRMPGGELSAAALTMLLYLVMHFVYAYVDMSWDTQSMVYVGTAMGLLNALERIVEKPVPTPFKRWKWEPEPTPAPTIVPLPEY